MLWLYFGAGFFFKYQPQRGRHDQIEFSTSSLAFNGRSNNYKLWFCRKSHSASSNEGLCKQSTWILDYTHSIADFPKKGIQFKWYGQLLRDPEAFKKVIHEFAERYRDSDVEVIAGLDSRGFIFGAALAYELKLPFILILRGAFNSSGFSSYIS